jgi:hypothetical protein
MRPSSPDTSEPAWMKRKMLSMSSSTSCRSRSRKCSAMVSAAWPTRKRPRRLVHLAEHHHGVVEHAGVAHLPVELLRLAAALADAAEQAHALVLPGHVVDELGDEHGLAHPRAAEQSGLAAALERASRSMALIPVSSVSDVVACSVSGTVGW